MFAGANALFFLQVALELFGGFLSIVELVLDNLEIGFLHTYICFPFDDLERSKHGSRVRLEVCADPGKLGEMPARGGLLVGCVESPVDEYDWLFPVDCVFDLCVSDPFSVLLEDAWCHDDGECVALADAFLHFFFVLVWLPL